MIAEFLWAHFSTDAELICEIAGFRIEGIEILDPFCVSKTFPTFYEELEKIYNCDGFDFGGNCENE